MREQGPGDWPLGGVFAQRAHSAKYHGDHPGNNPENHPPCGIMYNQFKTQKFKHLMLAMGTRDLKSAPYSHVHCSSHSMTSFQSSELTEIPVVENSQLFAQRAHSACTARAQRTVRPLKLHRPWQVFSCFVLRYAHCAFLPLFPFLFALC